MKNNIKKLREAVKRDKEKIISEYSSGDITLKTFVERLKDIEFVEEYIRSQEPNEKVFLDAREIRELGGKTLYISLPRSITNYGLNRGDKFKIYVVGDKIIMEKTKK